MFTLKITLPASASTTAVTDATLTMFKAIQRLMLRCITDQSQYTAIYAGIVISANGVAPTVNHSTVSGVDYFDYPASGMTLAMYSTGTGFVNNNLLGISSAPTGSQHYKYCYNGSNAGTPNIKDLLTSVNYTGNHVAFHTVMGVVVSDKFVLVWANSGNGSVVSSLHLAVPSKTMLLHLSGNASTDTTATPTTVLLGDSAPTTDPKFISLITNQGVVYSTMNNGQDKPNKSTNASNTTTIPPMINLTTAPVKPAFQFKTVTYGQPEIDHSAQTGLLLMTYGLLSETLETQVVNGGTTYNVYGHFLLPA